MSIHTKSADKLNAETDELAVRTSKALNLLTLPAPLNVQLEESNVNHSCMGGALDDPGTVSVIRVIFWKVRASEGPGCSSKFSTATCIRKTCTSGSLQIYGDGWSELQQLLQAKIISYISHNTNFGTVNEGRVVAGRGRETQIRHRRTGTGTGAETDKYARQRQRERERERERENDRDKTETEEERQISKNKNKQTIITTSALGRSLAV